MKRYAPVLIGAIVLFLLSVGSAFGQQEEVRFIDPNDINPDGTLSDNTPDDQEWARQGGRIGLMLFSDDLDTPVKRVLIPGIDATMVGRGNVGAHTATITRASSGVADSLSAGDYVLIGQNTVRMVESVSGSRTVTLDQPFASGMSNATIYRINDSVTDLGPWDDNYSSYAMAEMIGRNDADYRESNLVSMYDSRHAITDSDVGNGATTTPLARISGSPTGTVNTNDVLVVKVSGSASEMIPVDYVSGDRIEMEDVPGATSTNPLGLAANETAYLVYWADERNETGSLVTIRSRARPGPVTAVLTETTPRSGQFVLEIETVAPLDAHGNRVVFDAGASPPALPVNPRDAVTLAAADASATLQVESTPPAFSALSPAHNTPLRDARPEVSARVTDGESGLRSSTIYVVFRITEGSRTWTVELRPRDYGDVDPIPGGFEIRQRLPGADAPTGDAVIEWWVRATDIAGNVGYSYGNNAIADRNAPTLTVAHAASHVRIDSPIPVTATFSEPVSGFTSSEVSVTNGAAGNLVGSDGGRVYSFDVTPTAIGHVTVDIPAGVAEDIDGNGNTAAAQLSLGIPYDDDHDDTIDLNEAITAVSDYFSGNLTLEHAIAVVQLYFRSPG